MKVNAELIRQLTKSNADNAAEELTELIQDMAERYSWEQHEALDVAEAVGHFQEKSAEAAIDTASTALKEGL